jgi:hypothetical protein
MTIRDLCVTVTLLGLLAFAAIPLFCSDSEPADGDRVGQAHEKR